MTQQEHLPELVFDISEIYSKPSGSRHILELDLDLHHFGEDSDIKPKSALKGKITLLKTRESIELIMEDLTIDVEMTCGKCLQSYTQNVTVESAEWSFYFDEKFKEHQDDLTIDRKNLLLDANDAIRQEIILHFPLILVCSPSCKGICAICGKNKNLENCDCVEVEVDTEENPLKALKDIWKP